MAVVGVWSISSVRGAASSVSRGSTGSMVRVSVPTGSRVSVGGRRVERQFPDHALECEGRGRRVQAEGVDDGVDGQLKRPGQVDKVVLLDRLGDQGGDGRKRRCAAA